MEAEVSLLCLQKAATFLYSEATQYRSDLSPVFWKVILILSSHLRLVLPSRFFHSGWALFCLKFILCCTLLRCTGYWRLDLRINKEGDFTLEPLCCLGMCLPLRTEWEAVLFWTCSNLTVQEIFSALNCAMHCRLLLVYVKYEEKTLFGIITVLFWIPLAWGGGRAGQKVDIVHQLY